MAEPVRLTTTAKAAGCAAKLSPAILDSVLKRLPPQTDPNLIVGFETSDDAAVFSVVELAGGDDDVVGLRPLRDLAYSGGGQHTPGAGRPRPPGRRRGGSSAPAPDR